MPESKLGLGGHSFIAELGNDPEASFDEQCAIVAACLDRGVRWIDTTYAPERVALGRALERLGRRGEARVAAWNFFRQPEGGEALPRFAPYGPGSLDEQLAELRTDALDLLVIHAHDDRDVLAGEIEQAAAWRGAGRVREIGLGMARPADLDFLDGLPASLGGSVGHVLAPYNAFRPGAAAVFARAKARGMGTVAMSPFVRGWDLDRAARESGVAKARAAALLLRWVTGQEVVDRVFVSMRRAEWVEANLAAEASGPLSDAEAGLVREWAAALHGA